jgi:hypothetical protein
VGAEVFFAVDEVVDLSAKLIHAPFAVEHERVEDLRRRKRLNLQTCIVFPALLQAAEMFETQLLIGVVDEVNQGVELGFDLRGGFMEGLKKAGVVSDEVAAETCLLVDEELREAVGVGDDLVGVVYCASTLLDAAECGGEDESQYSEGSNGNTEKANEKTGIQPGIHSLGPYFDSCTKSS